MFLVCLGINIWKVMTLLSMLSGEASMGPRIVKDFVYLPFLLILASEGIFYVYLAAGKVDTLIFISY